MIQMTSKPYTQESPDTAGVVYIVEDDEAVRDSSGFSKLPATALNFSKAVKCSSPNSIRTLSPFSSLTSECRA